MGCLGSSVGDVGGEMLEVMDRRFVRTGVLIENDEGGTELLLLLEPAREGGFGGLKPSSSGTVGNAALSLLEDSAGPRLTPMVDWLHDRSILIVSASEKGLGFWLDTGKEGGDGRKSGVVIFVKSEEATSELAE